MNREIVSFDTRIAENIRKYDLDTLYDTKLIHSFMRNFAEVTGVEVMLTNRDGDQIFCAGNFKEFNIDVVGNPGRKIMVKNRTVAHLYIKEETVRDELKDSINKLIDDTCKVLVSLGEQTYMYTESSLYIDELEEDLKNVDTSRANAEKHDPLTGVFNKTYFKKRMDIMERSEIAPVAVIDVNINDWRYANDNFGDEGSDRLIKIIAGILKDNARKEYVIGRTDGDVFVVMIAMPEDGEAEDFMSKVWDACDSYEDPDLTPSVAMGLAYRENVEEKIEDKLSDAEYMMFENKLEIKASIDYQRRLHRNGR